jgi:bacteriorhodopsin
METIPLIEYIQNPSVRNPWFVSACVFLWIGFYVWKISRRINSVKEDIETIKYYFKDMQENMMQLFYEIAQLRELVRSQFDKLPNFNWSNKNDDEY